MKADRDTVIDANALVGAMITWKLSNSYVPDVSAIDSVACFRTSIAADMNKFEPFAAGGVMSVFRILRHVSIQGGIAVRTSCLSGQSICGTRSRSG